MKSGLEFLARFLNWSMKLMAFPKGAAAILAEKDLHGSLVSNEESQYIAAGTHNVLPGDPERTIIVLFNLSSSEIYGGFSGSTSSLQGMLIPPNGGFVSLNVTEDYELVTLPVYIFSPVNINRLYILTMRRETGLQE